ncbi:MAG: UDP-N-acetylmuramoyl-L-alanine--D-glutamate ligase, partial [Firmicutes bacterium]|nr:UDP-N-acetylmuramoyl-L-alanine--D-glutamate ligase [Bacillota bacterium]
MKTNIYNGKKIIISGMARSGISAAKLLKKFGADVTVQDAKEREKLKSEAEKLEKEGIKTYLGKNPDDIISDFDILVMSPGVPCDLDFVKKAREAGVEVTGEIEVASSVCDSPIIGITGTNGKTTTTALTGEIVKNYKEKSEVVGNIGTPFCDKAALTDKDSFIVAELSSFQLETIHKFRPVISAVLNITPDHLNRHKTIENYIAAKERVFENQTDEDYLILNYDDEACRDMKNRARAKVFMFSRKEKVEGVYADDTSIYINMLGINEKLVDIDDMNIIGTHNTENAMAAVAMALCAKVPVEIIRKTLKEFKAVEHRIEFVKTVNGVDYYNDSKGTNPDAAIKAIEAMKKPIVLIGGGYDKGSDFTEWIEKFEGKVKKLIVIGAVTEKIEKTCDKLGFKNYERAESFEDAIDKCYSYAQSGDCVLLSPACAS